jgi:Bacterial Ig-like domain (group 3)
VVTLTTSASAKVGVPVQVSAGITAGASASGTIAFYENDMLIPACAAQPIITTFTADLSIRTAVCAWLPSQAGTRTISARYAGDTFNFAAQSNSVITQVVP